MIRRLLHYHWRFSRGMTLGVRAAIIDPEERVLLVRHGYVQGWHLPGGGVEPGESLIDALARELMEEGNVRLTGTPRLHGVFQNSTVSARDHVALYVVREFEWLGARKSGLEIREAKFCPVSALPEGTTAGTRRRIDEIVAARMPTVAW